MVRTESTWRAPALPLANIVHMALSTGFRIRPRLANRRSSDPIRQEVSSASGTAGSIGHRSSWTPLRDRLIETAHCHESSSSTSSRRPSIEPDHCKYLAGQSRGVRERQNVLADSIRFAAVDLELNPLRFPGEVSELVREANQVFEKADSSSCLNLPRVGTKTVGRARIDLAGSVNFGGWCGLLDPVR